MPSMANAADKILLDHLAVKRRYPHRRQKTTGLLTYLLCFSVARLASIQMLGIASASRPHENVAKLKPTKAPETASAHYSSKSMIILIDMDEVVQRRNIRTEKQCFRLQCRDQLKDCLYTLVEPD